MLNTQETSSRLPGMQPVSRQSNPVQTVLVRGTPEAVLRLGDVRSDWLFGQLSPEGRVKLLREQDLLAA